MTLSERDRATFAKMRRDTEDIIARRRRDDMTRNTKARQKALEDYVFDRGEGVSHVRASTTHRGDSRTVASKGVPP